MSWMEGHVLRPCKREHHLPSRLRVCVEYTCWEEGGNTDLTCTFLTSEVQILTLWAWTNTRKILSGEKKGKETDIWLFQDLDAAWSIPLKCIANKSQLKYFLGKKKHAMYCDSSHSSPSPQYNFQGDSVHKATRSTPFVSVHLYHTGELFTKKPPEIAKDYIKKKFWKQSILLSNKQYSTAHKQMPFHFHTNKKKTLKNSKKTNKKASKVPKPAHTSFWNTETY